MPVTPLKPTLGVGAVIRKPSVALPTERTEAVKNIHQCTYFIYGPQKIGKTSFSAEFERSALHIMFEPSGKDMDLFQVFPNSWEEFKAYVDLLVSTKHHYKFVTLDTIDLCFLMCSTFVCDRAGVAHPSAVPYGKLYQEIEVEFRDTLVKLAKVMGFVAISHAKEKEVKTRSGLEFTTTVPSAAKACNLVLAKFCDLTGYYQMNELSERELLIAQSPDVEAGNRLRNHFHYAGSGEPIDKIPMGTTPAEAFEYFKAAFDNALIKPQPRPKAKEVAPVKPALPIKR